MSAKKRCKRADKNPACPYLLVIDQTRSDIETVKKALVGDLETKEPGLIEQIRDIKQALRRKWTAKDYGTLFLGVAALITAVVASIK
jgi:hypothetical protein